MTFFDVSVVVLTGCSVEFTDFSVVLAVKLAVDSASVVALDVELGVTVVTLSPIDTETILIMSKE